MEVGEVGCMMVGSKLAGVWWERKRVYHRLVEDRTWLLWPILRVKSPSAGRD